MTDFVSFAAKTLLRMNFCLFSVFHSAQNHIDMITTIWDSNGDSMVDGDVEIPVGGTQFTFHLERRPKVEASEFEAYDSFCNSMNVDELWRNIQLSRGRGPTMKFVPPCPMSSGTLPKLQDERIG